MAMQFCARQKRWASLILILLISAAGIQLGYIQGYAFLACQSTLDGAASEFVREASRFREADGTTETPGWQHLTQIARAERARQSGVNKGFFSDCCHKGTSGAYTRILLPSCRIVNVFVRSHALIMAYIHCQDGKKADSLFYTTWKFMIV